MSVVLSSSSGAVVDPLEHVLAPLSVEGMVSVPLHAGGHWALAFTGRLDIRCEAVVEGACWLTAEGWDEPLRAEQGDCYLVVGRRRYRLGSDLETPAVPANPVYRAPDGTRRPEPRVGSGHDTTLAGAGFTFDVHAASLLLDVLPPVGHIPAASGDAAALRATIGLLSAEVGGDRLGRAAMLNRLSPVQGGCRRLACRRRAPGAHAPRGPSAARDRADGRLHRGGRLRERERVQRGVQAGHGPLARAAPAGLGAPRDIGPAWAS